MVDIIKWNDKYGWVATGLMMPSLDTPMQVTSRCPITRTKTEFVFDIPEERLAWHLTTEAQRQTAYHGFDPSEFDCRTYVIGPTRQLYEGSLCQLFWNKAPQSQYRLIIHRTPYVSNGQETPPDIWQAMMRSGQFGDEIGVDLGQHSSVMTFLEDLVKASSKGEDAVKQAFDECGHPYVVSRGFLDSCTQTEKEANLYE